MQDNKNNDLLYIWKLILNELTSQQINEGPSSGHIINPIVNTIYHRETAFAYQIFITEFIRSSDTEWFNKGKRAEKAILEELKYFNSQNGFNEPVWTPRGVKFRKGSLPATTMLFEAIYEGRKILGNSDDCFFDNEHGLMDYLLKCYLGSGCFAHDIVKLDTKSFAVINTSAMALFLIEKILHSKHEIFNEIKIEVKIRLSKNQRSDGFWPYVFPKSYQQIIYNLFFSNRCEKTRIFKKFLNIYNKVHRDHSIFFGDALHHSITLLYFIKSLNIHDLNIYEKKAIFNAWDFIREHLIDQSDGRISFDFDWEPKPRSPRYCNFIDTTTYFIIINLTYYLRQLNLISFNEYLKLVFGISKYIRSKLINKKGEVPIIEPYDGPREIENNIYPRPAESVAHKGALLSKVILDKDLANHYV